MDNQRWAERGSVLMLMPAAVLVLLVLGALSVDRAVAFGAQRDLVATAEAAANDAAGLGLSVQDLRDRGALSYDPDRIDRAVRKAAARADGDVTATWARQGNVVIVRLRRRVPLVFAPAIPGAAHEVVVTATATADLVRS